MHALLDEQHLLGCAVSTAEGAGCAEQLGPVGLPARYYRSAAAHGQMDHLRRDALHMLADRGPALVEARLGAHASDSRSSKEALFLPESGREDAQQGTDIVN